MSSKEKGGMNENMKRKSWSAKKKIGKWEEIGRKQANKQKTKVLFKIRAPDF